MHSPIQYPINLVDVQFNPNSRPRNKLKQYGGNNNLYTYATNRGRPYTQKLVEYEQIALFDTTVSFGMFALIDALLANLGEISHPDPEVQDYLRYNIERMGGLNDAHGNLDRGTLLYSSLYKMINCALWAGYSVTESLFGVVNGNLFIDDFATYHPASIIIRPDLKGRLVEGGMSRETFPSGIYQITDTGEQLLPMWKTVHLCRNEFYGNYYGISIIESIYKWHLLKEAYVDMMSVALDRYGNPIVAITVPLQQTSQQETDTETGEVKNLTTQEIIERQIASQSFSGGGNVLLLPQIDPELTPKIQVLTTGNNVGDTFLNAIDRCDREISKGLLTPYALVANDPNVSSSLTQRQMELFNRILSSIHKQFVRPILIQSFHRLIKLAFTRESANIPPSLPIKQSTRPEDRVALMQVISGLTENGYFNPTNEQDWSTVREMVDAPDRIFNSEDVEFVKHRTVYPLMKPTPAGTSGSAKPRDRSTETKVKGVGVGAGRPVGTSSPKSPSPTIPKN